MNVIAIVPARSGSKRVKHKNLLPVQGVPSLGYVVQKLKSTALFSHVVVSSDSKEYLQIAEEHGADISLLRNPSISDDYSTVDAVIVDAIGQLETEKIQFKAAALFYATSFSLETKTIRNSFDKFLANSETPLLSVAKFSSPIERSYKLNAENLLVRSFPEFYKSRTQDLNDSYYDNGKFCYARKEEWLKLHEGINVAMQGFPMSVFESQDIDTLEDYEIALEYIKIRTKYGEFLSQKLH